DAAPIAATAPVAAPEALPLLLSGKTEAARAAQARQLAAHLAAHPELSLLDVAASLATTRTHFDHRAAIVAGDRSELIDALDALARGETATNTASGTRVADGKVVFVFPGQGSQWAGMALPLLATSSVFRDHIAACERAFAPYVDWSLT